MARHQFALIGCGAVGQHHISAIADVPSAELAALCDVRKATARRFGESAGVPWYTDYKKMIREQPEIGIVNICTPSGLHMKPALDVMAAGKHCVVEKPLEITTERIDQIIDAERQSKAIVASVYQSRFRPLIRKMKSLFDNGLLGEIYSGSVYIKRYRTQEYYDSGGWRGTWKIAGGGCLMHQGRQREHLVGFAGVAEQYKQVLAADAAKVAVHRLGRMQKMAWRSRGRQRGGNLPPDDPALAQPADDHRPLARSNPTNRPRERLAQMIDHVQHRPRLGTQHTLGQRQGVRRYGLVDRVHCGTLVEKVAAIISRLALTDNRKHWKEAPGAEITSPSTSRSPAPSHARLPRRTRQLPRPDGPALPWPPARRLRSAPQHRDPEPRKPRRRSCSSQARPATATAPTSTRPAACCWPNASTRTCRR